MSKLTEIIQAYLDNLDVWSPHLDEIREVDGGCEIKYCVRGEDHEDFLSDDEIDTLMEENRSEGGGTDEFRKRLIEETER
jgi:hypothetical protein